MRMEPPDSAEFTSPKPNVVVSRTGFSVEVKHHFIVYTEADKEIEIFAEWLATREPQIVLRRSDVDTPDPARMIENIVRAFAYKGWQLIVEQ